MTASSSSTTKSSSSLMSSSSCRSVSLILVCCIFATGHVAVMMSQSSWSIEMPSIPCTTNTAETTQASSSDSLLSFFERGVDTVYLDLLKEAEERSASDFSVSHQRGERGFVIGPTEGDFERHTGRALRNARRLRNVLSVEEDTSSSSSVKLAFMTSPEHIEILNNCKGADKSYYPEACRMWANGTLFDDVIATKEGQYQHNDNHTNVNQGSSKYWLKALGGYRYAPYKASIFLDSDAYPCPGVEKLFHIANPFTSQRYWQLPSTAPADFAAGMDQFPFGTGYRDFFTPGDRAVLTDFQYFPERNTGTVLFHFHRRLSHTFAHFIPLVSEHVYNNVATERVRVTNDQCPFKIALYLFRRLHPEFVDYQLPMHTSCRAYPGPKRPGTDGFENGMYPRLPNGKHCRDCACTPCLITHHAGSYFATVNGQKGWEDDFVLNVTANS